MADTLTHLTARKPAWLKVPAPGGPNYLALKHLMRDLKLHTVCEEAHCPNIGECWEHRAATFMILGDVCTRNCAYCAVAHGTPSALDTDEPARLAAAVDQMDLRHVVITSVDRDDLPNGGAEIFAAAIAEIRRRRPGTSVEVLIPDFKGSERALRIVVEAKPDILNHNLETIERLYRLARPGGRDSRALELLRRAKEMDAGTLTKSGIICGLGEEWDELLVAMRDLRARSEEHTSELQSQSNLVCRLLLEKKKNIPLTIKATDILQYFAGKALAPHSIVPSSRILSAHNIPQKVHVNKRPVHRSVVCLCVHD